MRRFMMLCGFVRVCDYYSHIVEASMQVPYSAGRKSVYKTAIFSKLRSLRESRIRT